MTRPLHVALVCSLFLVSGCAADQSPVKLRVSVESSALPKKIDWIQGKLQYEAVTAGAFPNERVTVSPTAAEWRQFRKTLDDVQFWAWLPAYRCETMIADGEAWVIEIEFSDAKNFSSGIGCYPGAIDSREMSGEATERFEKVRSSLEGLIGRWLVLR